MRHEGLHKLQCKDRDIVRQIADAIRPYAEPMYWDKNKQPGEEVWQTIRSWIVEADCVIAVITDKVVRRGESVNQEIGYAQGHKKIVIPMVAKGVDKNRLGCLNGVTHVEFDGDDMPGAIDQINQKITAMDRTKRKQQGWVLVAVVGIALFVLSGQE